MLVILYSFLCFSSHHLSLSLFFPSQSSRLSTVKDLDRALRALVRFLGDATQETRDAAKTASAVVVNSLVTLFFFFSILMFQAFSLFIPLSFSIFLAFFHVVARLLCRFYRHLLVNKMQRKLSRLLERFLLSWIDFVLLLVSVSFTFSPGDGLLISYGNCNAKRVFFWGPRLVDVCVPF